MRCVDCGNFSLKAQPRAMLGLYRCEFIPRWQSNNPFTERECKDFKPAPEDQREARVKWEKGEQR